MKKRILLIGGNYSPELTGIGKYNGEMIEWLANHGCECSVITTYPYYPQWRVQEPYTRSANWYRKEISKGDHPLSIIRCPHYVPQNPTGLKRLLSDLSIFVSTFFALFPLLFKTKFDYVITVAPPFTLGLLGYLYKKLKGATFIYHVQDLQVDAAKELGMIKSSSLLYLLFKVEKLILRKANVVSTISSGMMQKLENICQKTTSFFPNWVDVNAFYPIPDKTTLKIQFGFEATDKVILYSGAIGEKQGLEMILHAAKELQFTTGVKFVICGHGPYQQKLITLQKELNVNNVYFLPLQPYHLFNQFLNMADVHLVIQKGNASDLVLPSKLSTILAVGGVSIVMANPGTSLYKLMQTSDMGYVIVPQDQMVFNSAILLAVASDNSAKAHNARIYAENRLSQEFILSTFSQQILHAPPNKSATLRISKVFESV
ncbi:MAG: WcaI family glycosyltransferase [Chitinophagaceae bacterium]|nr:WcaI family glycosyltransferase [Chitinophagaceae bacterium]